MHAVENNQQKDQQIQFHKRLMHKIETQGTTCYGVNQNTFGSPACFNTQFAACLDLTPWSTGNLRFVIGLHHDSAKTGFISHSPTAEDIVVKNDDEASSDDIGMEWELSKHLRFKLALLLHSQQVALIYQQKLIM